MAESPIIEVCHKCQFKAEGPHDYDDFVGRVRCGNCGAHPVSVEHVKMCYQAGRKRAGRTTKDSDLPQHAVTRVGSTPVQQFQLSDTQIADIVSGLVALMKNAGDLSPYLPSSLNSLIERCQWFVPFCINCNSEITFHIFFHEGTKGVFLPDIPAKLSAHTRCTSGCPRDGNNLRSLSKRHNPFEQANYGNWHNILDHPYVDEFFRTFTEVSTSNLDVGESVSVKISNPFRNVLAQLAADAAELNPKGWESWRHEELVSELLERNEKGIAASHGTNPIRPEWIPVGEAEFNLLSLQLSAERFFVFEVARSRHLAYFGESNQKAPFTFDELLELVLWMEKQSNDYCKSVVEFFYSNAFVTPRQFEAAAKLKNTKFGPGGSGGDDYSGPSDLDVLREMAADYGWNSVEHFLDSLED